MYYTYIKGDLKSTIRCIPKYMNVYGSDFQCDSPNNVSDYLPVSVTVFVPKNGDLNTINPPQRQFPSINGSSSFTFKRSQEF